MKRSDNSSYNQTFLYPKQGAAVYVEKLLEGLSSEKILLNETATSIDTKLKKVVTTKDEYSYEYLVSSIPLNQLVTISDIGKEIDESLFSYNQVLVLNLGFDKPSKDKNVHWIYFPSNEINFYRAGFYNNIIGSENLSMYIEIGYPQGFIITPREIDDQLKETIQGLKTIGIIDEHNLVAYETIVMNPAYVHITKRSIDTVKKLEKQLEERSVFIVGRYGKWKYCSIEDCMLDSLKTVEKTRFRTTLSDKDVV